MEKRGRQLKLQGVEHTSAQSAIPPGSTDSGRPADQTGLDPAAAMDTRERIRAAFAGTPKVSAGGIATSGDPESEDLCSYFTGKSWDEHPVGLLRQHASALSFFTPEGFRYFLPAFMLAELDDPLTADIIADSILYQLYQRERGAVLIQHLAPHEREAVACFLEECEKRYPGKGFAEGASLLRAVVAE